MESINYSEKILTFNLLVGNNDNDKALNYLTKANWDETKAAQLYNKDKESKINKFSFYDYNDYKPISNTNRINNINNNVLLSSPYNDINNLNNYSNFNDILFGSKNKKTKVDLQKLNTFPECPIFEKKFFHKLAITKVDNNKYYRKFSFYPKCTLSYSDFIYRLKNNVGIILLFNDSTVDNAVQVLRTITHNELTRDLINNRTVILPLSNNTLEGSQLCKRMLLKSKRNDFPTILICFYKNERNFALIGDIKNVMDNMHSLSNTLLQAFDLFIEDKILEPFNYKFSSIIDPPKSNVNKNKNKIINSIPYDYNENFDLFNNSNKIINDNIINNQPNNLINDYQNNNINSIINQPNNFINDYQYNNINDFINLPNNLINDNQYNNFINDTSNRNSNSNNNLYNKINDNNNYLSEGLNRNSKIIRDSYSYMTDGEVLAKQENEIKKLENIVEQKRLEEEKKEKEEKEEENRIKQEELMQKMQVETLVKILPKEPSDEDPNKCTILFRFPDGEKVVQRKFLKTDIVALLYLYIKSLGREIYDENNENHFSLIQSFPFKNLDEVQSNTLEQEGLYPNAMLQIKAIE